MNSLSYGDRGADVVKLQTILKEQGFFEGQTLGNFLDQTLAAVKYFQATHLNQDRKQLAITGVVDTETWWALLNPSGEGQRVYLDSRIPQGLTAKRNAMAGFLLGEHSKGVREIPDGSNWSDEIRKFGGWPPSPSRRSPAWCMGFYGWGLKRVGLWERNELSTYSFWMYAKKHGWFFPVGSKDPRAVIPMNALLFQHKDSRGNFTRTGHITAIVNVDEAGTKFNTVGGNEGNRVSFRIRSLDEHDVVGTINPFPIEEQPIIFERRIITAKGGSPKSTR